MKNFLARSLSAYCLLIIFSLKVSVPLLVQLSRERQEIVAEQEDSTPEKSPDKSAREWEPEAVFYYTPPWLPIASSNPPSPIGMANHFCPNISRIFLRRHPGLKVSPVLFPASLPGTARFFLF